jgi:hypothetical protein
MDGNKAVVFNRIKDTVGASIGNDRFHEQGKTGQAARQAIQTAGKAGVHRLWKAPLPEEEVSNEQLEMLERIRVAAGQTS